MQLFRVFGTIALEGMDAVRDALREANEGGQAFSQRLADMGRQAEQIGRQMSTWVTLPLQGVAATALVMGGSFQAAMNEVAAVSGATGEQLAGLRDLAKDLGATTQFSASQAAEAMKFLAMAGFDANQIMASLPGTLQLAASAGLDLGQAADIVSNILSGYGMEVSELARVNDVLVKTFTSSNTNLSQLGFAMKYAGPIASAAGMQFEEAAAAIGLMGNAGIQGEMAGTALRGILARLLMPTDAVRERMHELGLTFTDAQGRLLPLDDVLQQLGPHANDAAVMMELFGLEAGPAMTALVSQGADALRELRGELEQSGGTAERVAAVQMEGFNGAVKELKSAFEALMIAVAEAGLLDFMADMARGLAAIVRNLSETNPELLKMATIVGAIVSAVGPLLIALGMAARLFAALRVAVAALAVLELVPLLFNPIGLAVAAVGAIIAGGVLIWRRYGEAITEWAKGALATVKEWAGGVIAALAAWASGAIAAVGRWASATLALFAELPGKVWAFVRDLAAAVVDGLRDMAARALEAVSQWATDTLSWFGDVGRRALDAIGAMIAGVIGFFVGLPGQLLAALGSLGETVLGGLRSMAGLGMEAVRGFAAGVLDVFRSLPSAVAGYVAQMASGVVDRITGMVDRALSALRRLYDEAVGNSIIPDMARDVIAEVAGMADESVGHTRRMRRGMERAFPDSMPSLQPIAESTRAMGASGPLTVDLRHSIIRDERDLFARLRRHGVEVGA